MAKNQFLPAKVRRPRAELEQTVETIEGVGLTVAGSWRRERTSIGDLDILVPHNIDFEATIEEFAYNFDYEPRRSGSLKSEGIARCWFGKPYNNPLLLNLWKVPQPQSWAGMLLFATGPNDLNIVMRAWAKGRGWKLSQYGLMDDEGHQRDKGDEEEQIFALLNLPYLAPNERDDYNARWQGTGIDKPDLQVIEVWSSDGETLYPVTMENGKAKLCVCKGFQYRSHCRHLEEAEAIARERRGIK